MSAWLVTDESLTKTRNSLIAHLGFDPKKADKMVKGWAKLNRYALMCRYGDTHKAFKFTDTEAINSPVQTHKSLACLAYQCSEGEPEKDMPMEWFSLIGVRTAVENKFKINDCSQEYNDAKWD